MERKTRTLKVSIAADLEERVRRRAGSEYGARKGALSEAVANALERWVEPGEPDLYIGTVPGGMSFELPVSLASELVLTAAEQLAAGPVKVSFKEDGRYVEASYPIQQLPVFISARPEALLNSSFVAEFGAASLYTGGGGCFSLRGELAPEVQREIVRRLTRCYGDERVPSKRLFHMVGRRGKLEEV